MLPSCISKLGCKFVEFKTLTTCDRVIPCTAIAVNKGRLFQQKLKIAAAKIAQTFAYKTPFEKGLGNPSFSAFESPI